MGINVYTLKRDRDFMPNSAIKRHLNLYNRNRRSTVSKFPFKRTRFYRSYWHIEFNS